jgi:hypothetical protein
MNHRNLLLWNARILGIAVSVFLGLFALDALEPGRPFSTAVAALAIHLLPALAVLAIVVVSWRRPWIGGLAFVMLAVAYALMVPSRLDWILVISGPLLAVGLLFLWSWRSHQHVNVS